MYILGKIGIERRYRLRWRFDFASKPTRRGIWNNAGGSQEEGKQTSAWCVNKTGLVRAFIEAENQLTWAEGIVAEADGHDFVNFRWLAATPAPMSSASLGRDITLIGQIIGLALDTREFSHTVYVDGTRRTEPRTASDKAFNLAGF